MFRLWLLAGALTISATSVGAESNTEDEAYEALLSVAKITSKTINPVGCLITSLADFEEYNAKLPVFREAWLNRDYSVDFYRQRRKQFLIYVVLKRYAGLITEGVYKEQGPRECAFSLSVSYPDKLGQQQTITAVTWEIHSAKVKGGGLGEI